METGPVPDPNVTVAVRLVARIGTDTKSAWQAPGKIVSAKPAAGSCCRSRNNVELWLVAELFVVVKASIHWPLPSFPEKSTRLPGPPLDRAFEISPSLLSSNAKV